MMALKTRLRLVLLADATFARMLNFVPGTQNTPEARRAIYLAHLSQFQRVLYPAVSIFIEGGGDFDIPFAEDIPVQMDFWTQAHPDPAVPGIEYGATGAWAMYRRARRLLNQAHLNQLLADPAYHLMRFSEVAGSVSEIEFDVPQELHHVSTRFRARIYEADAVEITPN